jgi:hypothetical protein
MMRMPPVIGLATESEYWLLLSLENCFRARDDLLAVVDPFHLIAHGLNAVVKAGTAKLARIAMIVITTNNSIRVKAWFRCVFIVCVCLWVGYDVMWTREFSPSRLD